MQTKIIATIGPASRKLPILKKMIKAGMKIARVNTKYGNQKIYLETLELLKQAGKCKVLFDIKGLAKIKFLQTLKFDYLAVSFSESVTQIKKLKKLFPKQKIIAKIESKKGLKNLDQLIKVSDGIMVARGDLGENISLEKVPITQKLIIKKCAKAGKFDITATEMLLSMVNAKTPERAEVSDVANAILDGSDALMLSEETAIGKHPVLAVEMMARVIKEVEKNRYSVSYTHLTLPTN